MTKAFEKIKESLEELLNTKPPHHPSKHDTEMTLTEQTPSPEALEAAEECVTEDGAGGLHLVVHISKLKRIALAFDAFAEKRAAEVRKELGSSDDYIAAAEALQADIWDSGNVPTLADAINKVASRIGHIRAKARNAAIEEARIVAIYEINDPVTRRYVNGALRALATWEPWRESRQLPAT